MEGMGIAKDVAGLVTAIGLVPTLIILGVIAFFIIREVKKENEATRKAVTGLKQETLSQITALKEETAQKLEDLKKHSDEKDKTLTERFTELEKEVKCIQMDYITKEQHYQDTEGWKAETQGIRQEVTKLPLEILKLLKTTKD